MATFFFLWHFFLPKNVFCLGLFYLGYFLFSGKILPPVGGETDEDEVLISMSGAPASSINC